MVQRELAKSELLGGFRSLNETSGKIISEPGARPPLSHSEYACCVFDKTAVARMCEVRKGVSMRIRIGSEPYA